jgi:hypothetical protein
MAGKRIPRKLTGWAHEFGRGVAIAGGIGMFLVLALVLSRSGVSGRIYAPVCKPSGTTSHCSLEPMAAAIHVTVCVLESAGRYPYTGWETKAGADGRFHVDLPPGGYCLDARSNESFAGIGGAPSPAFVGGTAFPVFAGQVTQLQLLLLRQISGGICLASSDRIATPSGAIAVSQLQAGMIVWTLDASGRRVATPVLVVSHVPAPAGHHVLRVVLADGRTVEASAGHPTLTGRLVGTFRPGDLLDGSSVTAVESIPYAGDTWDLLPAGPTGVYWANDVLLSSTLRSRPLQLHAA